MNRKDNWCFDGAACGRLGSLVQVISPSMNERAMASRLRTLWADAGIDTVTDVMGNLHGVANPSGTIHVGLAAHMDTVAIQITRILPGGQMQFRSIGLSQYVLLGQRMKVLTGHGCVDGVIGFDPTSQYGQPKGLVPDDLWLDIGARDYEEASAQVEVGDLAVLSPVLNDMCGDCLCGTGMDNRVGLFVMTECVTAFARSPHPAVCLHALGTVQEEVGLRGAAVAAAFHRLDACFVLDVDYATDTPTPHENQMGALHLGRGVGLHVKSDNSPILRELACDVARRRGIPFQKTLGRFLYGGTDASPLQLQCGGMAVLNVNIPCRYMHSPAETCSKSDVESAIRLLWGMIGEIGDRRMSSFVPY